MKDFAANFHQDQWYLKSSNFLIIFPWKVHRRDLVKSNNQNDPINFTRNHDEDHFYDLTGYIMAPYILLIIVIIQFQVDETSFKNSYFLFIFRIGLSASKQLLFYFHDSFLKWERKTRIFMTSIICIKVEPSEKNVDKI